MKGLGLWDISDGTSHIPASKQMEHFINSEETERPLRPGSAHLVADMALGRRLDWRPLMTLPNWIFMGTYEKKLNFASHWFLITKCL